MIRRRIIHGLTDTHWQLVRPIVVGTALLVAGGIVFGLGGCAGTAVSFDGQICGHSAQFTVADRKDRGTFLLDGKCPLLAGQTEAGTFHVETADSSTSAVITAQANAAEKLAGAVGTLAGAVGAAVVK